MTLLIKCRPTAPGSGGILDVEVPVYESAYGHPGDQAFVWFAESYGGKGLAMRGILMELTPVAGKHRRVRIRIIDDRVSRSLDKAALVPYRDAPRTGPLPKLAYRLYKHSLQKVTNIDADEEAFLLAHFSGLTG
jgi:hypothetical protein